MRHLKRAHRPFPGARVCDLLAMGKVCLADRCEDGLYGNELRVVQVLSHLRARTMLVTRVGKDGAGERLTRVLRRCGIESMGIQRDPMRPTDRRPDEREGQSGQSRKGSEQSAHAHLNPHLARIASLSVQPRYVYFSSEFVRSEQSRRAVMEVMRNTSAKGVLDSTVSWDGVSPRHIRDLIPNLTVLLASRTLYEELCSNMGIARVGGVEQMQGFQRVTALEDLVVFSEEGITWSKNAMGEVAHKRLSRFGDGDKGSVVFSTAVAILLLGVLHDWSRQRTLDRASLVAEQLSGDANTSREDQDRWFEHLARVWGIGSAPGSTA